MIAEDLFVFDKIRGPHFDYDDWVREFIHELYNKKKITFDALFPGHQIPSENNEALIGYSRDKHYSKLVQVLKQRFGIKTFFDTKESINWRFEQENDIVKLVDILTKYNIALYAAYTGRGKSKIALETAARLFTGGGIILITTPIGDTKKSFEENIRDYHFGTNRSRQITYIDGKDFSECKISDLRTRAEKGELLFICITVQDARYKDLSDIDITKNKIREKYNELATGVDLWIRDERHFQYNAATTSERLGEIKSNYTLDLSATPYNSMDFYPNEQQILARTLLWGIDNKINTNLPDIKIDIINTPFCDTSLNIRNLYTTEEGFDPRKLFLMNQNQFILGAEIIELAKLFYINTRAKQKNPLSIVNDCQLSDIAKNCGLWVLPNGQDGTSSGEYMPILAKLLNYNIRDIHFVDSYTVAKDARSNNRTIGNHIKALLQDYKKVIILTCGKFTTGTDIEDLGHIVLFDKIENIANFEQLLGRMIRPLNGKNCVKLYSVVPGQILCLILGKLAKTNELLSGNSLISFLECIPLSEYDIQTKDYVQINPTDILQELIEWSKKEASGKLSTQVLTSFISKLNFSKFNIDNLKQFKFKTPKSSLSDSNGSKVKKTVRITGMNQTKKSIGTIEKIVQLVQTIVAESQWISVSTADYDYKRVLKNSALIEMFGKENIDLIFDLIEQDVDFEQFISDHYRDKYLAYKDLEPRDSYPEVFCNSKFKQKLGLVYVPFELADKIGNDLLTMSNNCYNKICVINALNGTLPLTLRKIFPNAEITCAEYFPYYKEHLTRLGFIVKDWSEIKDMKFDVIVGNPPYNDSSIGNIPIYQKFVNKAINMATTVAMIIPASCSISDERHGRAIRSMLLNNHTKCVQFLSNRTFETANVKTMYFIYDQNYYGVTDIHSMDGETYSINSSKASYLIEKKILSEILTKCNVINSTTSWIKFDRREFDSTSNSRKVNTVIQISKDDIKYEKTFSSDTTIKNHRVITSFLSNSKNHLDVVWYIPPGIAVKKGYTATVVDNEMIGMNLATYLKSNLCKFIYEKTKTSRSLRSPQLKFIPKVTLSKKWTDKALYKYFNLTKEEIAYVEANIK